MIRSMTGFGRAEDVIDGIDITVEVKSVNHRYFEYNCRVPRAYLFLEEKLKPVFQKRISRGKVDVFVTVDAGESLTAGIEVNHAFAAEYINALKELKDAYGLQDDISVSAVARNSDVFVVKKPSFDEDSFFSAVSSVAQKAIDVFVAMRTAEGERLSADIRNRVDMVLKQVDFIEKKSPVTVAQYREKIEQKVKDLLQDVQIDEQRILTETAIFSDKIAVDEETVRLRSHMEQLFTMLESKDAVGRKLDFLVQEMNREANTIGSKAQDVEIARAVVEIKSEIEKIREQVQNIE